MPALLWKALMISFILIIPVALQAQYYILGRVLDDNEQPYPFATAELRGEGESRQQTCSELGVFRFEDLKSGTYELTVITPYGIRRKKIELRGSIDVTLHISRNIQINEISVVARRAGSSEPVTHQNISGEALLKKNTGQDMPYLLEGTPSLVTTSDAGHGIGYTGLRIRGSDPTRINVTLNGVPVNDAESQNVFWVDLPDLVSSTNSIQIQRGIGWSQPGAGDLGAGIHVNTMGFEYSPYAGVQLGAGSFDTRRATLSAGSGLIKGRFTIDGRGSYLRSEGFIDRASSQLYSVYGALGYHHDLTNVRFIYTSGDELTYQAWNGVPEQFVFVDSTRTFNTAGIEKSVEDPHDNEVDDYRQSHYQMHVDQAITPFARWSNTLHYTRGIGFFEQYKADQLLSDYNFTEALLSDLIRRRWLDNHFYGFISTLQIGSPAKRYLVLGGGWNKYDGDHFGEVIWTEAQGAPFSTHEYYRNDATKKDWNIFGRTNMKISEHFDVTVDLQGRWVDYSFTGPAMSGDPERFNVRHRFFNPKLGFRYILSEKSGLYALTGLIGKEPNRDDYTESSPSDRPRAEKLWDTEIGYRLTGNKLNLDITGYYMRYKDQILPTGRLNDVGAYTRVNVKDSHRAGIEIHSAYKPVSRLTIQANATFSSNKIDSFDEYLDNWDTGVQEIVRHKNTDIAFSPGLIANLQADLTFLQTDAHEMILSVGEKFVGRQYVDNTSNLGSALESYYVTDLGLSWSWKTLWAQDFRLGIFFKNVFDHQYESNGWIYRFISSGYNPVPDDPYAGHESADIYHLKGYFPQAGRHLYINLGVTF